MEATSLNLDHGCYIMDLTPWKFPSGIYTMEVTSITCAMEVSSCTLHHRSYQMEPKLWKVPHGTYSMEDT